MNDDKFPIIVPEDDGFAIYVDDERVDWYDNEADAEGVALSMVDKELNDESFFDRPLEESVSETTDIQSEIINAINTTNNFKAKVDGQYVRILYNNTTLADFSLEEGVRRSYAPRSLNPSSRGDGKNTFRILDVGGRGWSDLSFKDFYSNEQLLSKHLDTLGELCRYYTLKTLYDSEFIYGCSVPEEANNWLCAQWGTWKFIINSLDDVKTCLIALENGFDMAQEKYSTLHESVNLKESTSKIEGFNIPFDLLKREALYFQETANEYYNAGDELEEDYQMAADFLFLLEKYIFSNLDGKKLYNFAIEKGNKLKRFINLRGSNYNEIYNQFIKYVLPHLEKNKANLTESSLKESFDSPNGYGPLFTGLPYKEAYSSIISSFVGQIWDGIGEGSGRESRIFNYYYKEVDFVRSGSINGEFVVYAPAEALDQIIRGIWCVAQIERSDNGSTNKNIYYDYLDADWSDICKLQGALTAIAKRYNQSILSPSSFKNEPWSDEKKAANDARIAKAKADKEAKEAAEKKAKEEAEAAEKARFDQKQADITANIHPDAKDIMRAEDAWKRTFNKTGRLQDLYYQMQRQLDKITDIEKAKRRIVAFYQEALKHSDVDSYDYWIKRFKEKMDRDIDL